MYVYIRGSIAFNNTCFFWNIMAFRVFKLIKNIHLRPIFQIMPIFMVDNWKSAWIDKNSHISSPSNPTEMCQTFLESSDNGLQLLWRWTYSSEAQEAVYWPPKVKDSKIEGPPLDGCRRKGVINFSQVINSHQSLDSQSILD